MAIYILILSREIKEGNESDTLTKVKNETVV